MDNVIRVGVVSSINYETGMIQVTYPDLDDAVTDEFPVLTCGDEYHPPEVDDDVLVVHLSNGMQAGVVLGKFWDENNEPAETGAGLFRKELGRALGEAFIRYKDGVLQIKAPKSIQIVTDSGTFDLSTLIR